MKLASAAPSQPTRLSRRHGERAWSIRLPRRRTPGERHASRLFRIDGLPRSRQAAARSVPRAHRAGGSRRPARLRGRLVRRASLLELLHLPLSADHGGALRRGDQTHPSGACRGGRAALQPGAAARRDRHGRLLVRRPPGAWPGQRLSALRVRALRRGLGDGAADAERVPGHAAPRLRGRDLHLRGRALPAPEHAHQLAPGGGTPADLDRGRSRIRPPFVRAPRLRASVHGPMGRRRLPARDAQPHRRGVRRRRS